jgi:hypothetical protein
MQTPRDSQSLYNVLEWLSESADISEEQEHGRISICCYYQGLEDFRKIAKLCMDRVNIGIFVEKQCYVASIKDIEY